MGLPEENRLGYEKGSIVQGHDPNNYKNVDYTIIHGTDDDNVHFLNAVVMQKSLGQFLICILTKRVMKIITKKFSFKHKNLHNICIIKRLKNR